ncbi:MAG TPA: urate hydroxylase PuuD [Candidatus Sulfotelmatobacter sp.]|nr:urate hydroxylase PuuD [Candidatus Sulfotelmatobacter sp.]
MDFSIREWLNLGVRWFHVFAGIMWVGQTYYFTWLDGQFTRLEKNAVAGGGPASIWMVHSGGFYTVEKRQTLGVSASSVRWFRWEALMTWIAGMVLLVLVYYMGAGLIDPDVANISKAAGIAIGVGALLSGWIIYDVALRSPLGRSQFAFAIFAFVMTATYSWALLHLFSGRAAYLHMGAIFATIMTANVWEGILPAQRKMLAAAESGATFDPALGGQAKLRSKHNTFMAVPVVFLMLSNHYPVATYGNRYAWPVLLILILVGWAAAKVIREA